MAWKLSDLESLGRTKNGLRGDGCRPAEDEAGTRHLCRLQLSSGLSGTRYAQVVVDGWTGNYLHKSTLDYTVSCCCVGDQTTISSSNIAVVQRPQDKVVKGQATAAVKLVDS